MLLAKELPLQQNFLIFTPQGGCRTSRGLNGRDWSGAAGHNGSVAASMK
ncbi:hypothetical protein [Shinella sp. HZN7]|nr:hypothetical protein [Shinella sp. HZN7]